MTTADQWHEDAAFRLSVLVTQPADVTGTTLFLQAVGDMARADAGILTRPYRMYLQHLPLSVLTIIAVQSIARAEALRCPHVTPTSDEDTLDQASAALEERDALESILRGFFRCHMEHGFILGELLQSLEEALKAADKGFMTLRKLRFDPIKLLGSRGALCDDFLVPPYVRWENRITN